MVVVTCRELERRVREHSLKVAPYIQPHPTVRPSDGHPFCFTGDILESECLLDSGWVPTSRKTECEP